MRRWVHEGRGTYSLRVSSYSAMLEIVRVTHYGNPFDADCMDDEKNITFPSPVAGRFCSYQCHTSTSFVVDDSPVLCPSDVPDTVSAVPSCISYNSTQNTCALLCTVGASECGDAGTCEEISNGLGICTYQYQARLPFRPGISHTNQAIVGLGFIFVMLSICILRDYCKREKSKSNSGPELSAVASEYSKAGKSDIAIAPEGGGCF